MSPNPPIPREYKQRLRLLARAQASNERKILCHKRTRIDDYCRTHSDETCCAPSVRKSLYKQATARPDLRPHGRADRRGSAPAGAAGPAAGMANRARAVVARQRRTMMEHKMADNSLPAWSVSTGAITSAIAAWIGLILSFRREWHERPRLRFLFKLTPQYNLTTKTGVLLSVTITNTGAHPISLNSITCTFRYGDGPVPCSPQSLDGVKVERGEPVEKWVQLYGGTTDLLYDGQVEAVTVIDTTGKQWSPDRRERKQLRAICAQTWPARPRTSKRLTWLVARR